MLKISKLIDVKFAQLQEIEYFYFINLAFYDTIQELQTAFNIRVQDAF